MKRKLLKWFFMMPLCCCADVIHLSQQLAAIENESRDSRSTAVADLSKELLRAGPSLSSEDWRILLAQALKCMRSVNPNAQEAGLLVLYLGSQTGGATLLDPYVEELGGFLNSPDVSVRQSIMMTLAAEQPRISPKAAALLVEHLDDPPSPPANTPNIIYTLLVDFPSDSSLVHKLLKFAEKSPDPNVSAYALEGLKFINTLDSEALHFASASIRSPDPQIQAADIDLIEAKHLTVRAEFSQYLHRIATSPEEPQDLRLRAQHALAQ